jgi:hypothetical protein
LLSGIRLVISINELAVAVVDVRIGQVGSKGGREGPGEIEVGKLGDEDQLPVLGDRAAKHATVGFDAWGTAE